MRMYWFYLDMNLLSFESWKVTTALHKTKTTSKLHSACAVRFGFVQSSWQTVSNWFDVPIQNLSICKSFVVKLVWRLLGNYQSDAWHWNNCIVSWMKVPKSRDLRVEYSLLGYLTIKLKKPECILIKIRLKTDGNLTFFWIHRFFDEKIWLYIHTHRLHTYTHWVCL